MAIIVYGHPFCPMLPPVLGMLKQARVEYDYINIHEDDEARQRVREINNGNESVPTLVFPDGSTLTEPSGMVLRKRLIAEGYTVPVSATLIGNPFPIGIGLIILYAVLRFFDVI
jgi:mycoredoxin